MFADLFQWTRDLPLEGGLFLGYYAAYTCYLLLAAGQHHVLEPFSLVMGYFVIPLTVVTLSVILVRSMRTNRQLSSPPA